MQSLRDKLLKAGAVSKGQARHSKTESRQGKKKGREGLQIAQSQEQSRKERFERTQQQQAEAARQRETERQAQLEVQAHEQRVAQIIDRHGVTKVHGPDRLFYVALANRKIRKLSLCFAAADALIKGELGVAFAAHDPADELRVIRAGAIERLLELQPQRVLFFNRPGNVGDLPSYGATGPAGTQDDGRP